MRGFTLIETIVYLALFSLIMSGILPAITSMRALAARSETQALLLEEGSFIQETLDHAIGNGTSISLFHLSGSALMQTNLPISGNQVGIKNLILTQTPASGGEPSFVDSAFTLSANTDDGTPLTHIFGERIYIDQP